MYLLRSDNCYWLSYCRIEDGLEAPLFCLRAETQKFCALRCTRNRTEHSEDLGQNHSHNGTHGPILCAQMANHLTDWAIGPSKKSKFARYTIWDGCTGWTLVIWEKQGECTWHWLLTIYIQMFLWVETQIQLCAGSTITLPCTQLKSPIYLACFWETFGLPKSTEWNPHSLKKS